MQARQPYCLSVFCLPPLRASPRRNASPHAHAGVYAGVYAVAVFEDFVPHNALCPCGEKHEMAIFFRFQGEKPFAISEEELPRGHAPADWGGPRGPLPPGSDPWSRAALSQASEPRNSLPVTPMERRKSCGGTALRAWCVF